MTDIEVADRYSTWAGQSFETESGAAEGDIETKDISDGWLHIEASSVAMVSFHS